MMRYSVILLTLIISLNASAQIAWEENRKLVWEYFKAPPEKGHFASAMSNITFSIKIESQGNQLIVMIRPYFNPSASWVKPADKSDYLLQHEQLHFDIYELNARKFRKEIKEANLTPKNAQAKLKKMIKKYSKYNEKVQKQYDKQTNHSINTIKQGEWNRKIAGQLKEYKRYSKTQMYVNLK